MAEAAVRKLTLTDRTAEATLGNPVTQEAAFLSAAISWADALQRATETELGSADTTVEAIELRTSILALYDVVRRWQHRMAAI
jgi:hypothetical protein